MGALVLVLVAATSLAVKLPAVESGCSRGGGGGPVLFNFGDSNSDTGGFAAAYGESFGLPEGRLFFHRPTGRICDGRLIIDFLCESLNTSYLSPYLDSLEPDFTNGANFAISGATTMPRDRPFSLYIQVRQFIRFRARSLELVAKGGGLRLGPERPRTRVIDARCTTCMDRTHDLHEMDIQPKPGSKNLINEEGFQNALYLMDIGQNDLAGLSNFSYDQLVMKIPPILSEIENAVKTLYDTGAKSFWIHNTGPLGCLPVKLSLPRKDDSDLDPYGCLASLNNAAKKFNEGLSVLCDKLSSQLKDVTIVYTDIFSIKYDLIANSTSYGFESPLMACCGYGGPPYNFNMNITCRTPGFQVCPEGSRRISWDGVHYAEAATSIVASKVLSTNYSKPRLKFDYFCNP